MTFWYSKFKTFAFYFIAAVIAVTALKAFCLPSKVFLNVPFLCQAPYGNWGQPWQDACEEAAIIMAIHYIKGDPVNRESGNREILDLVDYQVKQYGGHHDLTAEQSARLIKDYYKFNNLEVRDGIAISDIKDELARGNVVIVPMAGRLLGNPYYTLPGPAYHYMLFKGYDDRTGEFITNDAGTKRGRNYRYKYRVAFNAISDFKTGRKAMIVVKYIN